VRKRAFTLVEILVVVAIVAILAAVFSPALRSMTVAAKQTTCQSRFRQATFATLLYVEDYSDRFTPANYTPDAAPNPAVDRTWVQLVLPYLRSFTVTRCPADTTHRPESINFDADFSTGNPEQRFYHASFRTNLGYNWFYLAPATRQGRAFLPSPREASSVTDPSRTLLFADSVWQVDAKGQPSGGGRFVITPPCRYVNEGDRRVDSFARGSEEIFAPSQGWDRTVPLAQSGGNVYGWHDGRATVARLDGSVRSLRMAQIWAGCDAKPHWAGSITNQENYLWDLR
jgi:prepilin-type N-terminal cleavage/methylation domain-containing protein/prepilin-type processing-associated H-X9-DG protein